jgi:hypothetical protein
MNYASLGVVEGRDFTMNFVEHAYCDIVLKLHARYPCNIILGEIHNRSGK